MHKYISLQQEFNQLVGEKQASGLFTHFPFNRQTLTQDVKPHVQLKFCLARQPITAGK